MSDWADATAAPEIMALLKSISVHPLPGTARSDASMLKKTSVAQRGRHELLEYFLISAYLFIYFSSLLFYK